MVKLKKFESWTTLDPQAASLDSPMADVGFARSKYNDSEIKNLISNDAGIRSHLEKLSFDEKLSLIKELNDFRNSTNESDSSESDSKVKKLMKLLSKYRIPIALVASAIGTVSVTAFNLSVVGLYSSMIAGGIILGICRILAEDEDED
jgi:hypothetical protein